MESKPLAIPRITPETPKPPRAGGAGRIGAPWRQVAAIGLGLLVLAGGCTKRVPVSATETNIADGRTFEIELTGDRRVSGKLTKGSIVRYEQGDSLFNAEVDEVTDEFIEFSRRDLVADQSDLTRLAKAQEDAAAGVERPELGGTLLPRDEIESVSLLTLDRRRIVVETICWTALLLTAGYAGLSH